MQLRLRQNSLLLIALAALLSDVQADKFCAQTKPDKNNLGPLVLYSSIKALDITSCGVGSVNNECTECHSDLTNPDTRVVKYYAQCGTLTSPMVNFTCKSDAKSCIAASGTDCFPVLKKLKEEELKPTFVQVCNYGLTDKDRPINNIRDRVICKQSDVCIKSGTGYDPPKSDADAAVKKMEFEGCGAECLRVLAPYTDGSSNRKAKCIYFGEGCNPVCVLGATGETTSVAPGKGAPGSGTVATGGAGGAAKPTESAGSRTSARESLLAVSVAMATTNLLWQWLY